MKRAAAGFGAIGLMLAVFASPAAAATVAPRALNTPCAILGGPDPADVEGINFTIQAVKDDRIIAEVYFCTYAEPEEFTDVAKLQFGYRPNPFKPIRWITRSTVTWPITALPPVGNLYPEAMTPPMKTECAPRSRWRILQHVFGISSSGLPYDFEFPSPLRGSHYIRHCVT